MRRWVQETLHTLTVTTYHPVGWSLGRIHRIKNHPHQVKDASLSDDSPTIALVHGLLHNPSAFYGFERNLRKKGHNNILVCDFWTSIRHMEELADELKHEIDVYLLKTSLLKHKSAGVSIVAHSLGGMVVRVALLDPLFAKKISKVIFLGTPHQGSRLYKVPLPPCVRDLAPQSPLLKRIKEEPLPGNISYWNIRGGLDFVTPMSDTFLPDVPNLSFANIGHAGLLSHPDVIQKATELLLPELELAE